MFLQQEERLQDIDQTIAVNNKHVSPWLSTAFGLLHIPLVEVYFGKSPWTDMVLYNNNKISHTEMSVLCSGNVTYASYVLWPFLEHNLANFVS